MTTTTSKHLYPIPCEIWGGSYWRLFSENPSCKNYKYFLPKSDEVWPIHMPLLASTIIFHVSIKEPTSQNRLQFFQCST